MSCPAARSQTCETGGGPLPYSADDDDCPPAPPAVLTAAVLTGEGWARVVVRAPDDVEVVSWPLDGTGGHDLALVDALARLQLAARRFGCSIRLRGAEDDVLGLIDLVGLKEVLTGDGPPVSGRQVPGNPEGVEQLEVEEVVLRDDSVT